MTSEQAETANVPDQAHTDTQNNGSGQPATPEPQVEYSTSAGLANLFRRLGVAIGFTSYQSGLLYMVGINPQGGINIHQAAMPKPMGLNREADGGLILASGYQIMRFKNVLEPEQQINHTFDACYVPRTVHVTGHLDAP